jgi:hypothetical protein
VYCVGVFAKTIIRPFKTTIFPELYRENNDYADYFMNNEVLEATFETVFTRVPHELPIAEMLLPLTFLCEVYNENALSENFDSSIPVFVIDIVLRLNNTLHRCGQLSYPVFAGVYLELNFLKLSKF